MSGKTETEYLILGACSSAAIAAVFMKTSVMQGTHSDRKYFIAGVNVFKLIIYLIWLTVQIIKSSVYVTGVTLFRRSEVNSSVFRFRADYDNPAAKAMLANSITLTPGTIAVDITEDGFFSAHALTEKAKADLLDGSMQAKIAWLFGEKIDFSPADERDIPATVQECGEKDAPKTYRIKRRKAL